MHEDWWADDLLLTEHLVRDVEMLDGLYSAPPSVGANIEVPARHGTVWRPKRAGEGSFVINLWIAGSNPDGSIPGGGSARSAYERHLAELLRVLRPYHRLVRFARELDDGTARECYGEVIARLEPTHLNYAAGRLAVEVAVPGAFWRSTVKIDQTLRVPASGATLRFAAFAAGDAPLTDYLMVLRGPINTPVLTAADSGEWLRYGANVPEEVLGDPGAAVDGTITFDVGRWSVSSPPTGYPGLASVTFSGGYMLELPADPRGPGITVTGVGVGANTSLRLIGRPQFHF